MLHHKIGPIWIPLALDRMLDQQPTRWEARLGLESLCLDQTRLGGCCRHLLAVKAQTNGAQRDRNLQRNSFAPFKKCLRESLHPATIPSDSVPITQPNHRLIVAGCCPVRLNERNDVILVVDTTGSRIVTYIDGDITTRPVTTVLTSEEINELSGALFPELGTPRVLSQPFSCTCRS